MKIATLSKTSPAAMSEFARLLEEKQYLAIPKVGDVVKGQVLSVAKNEIHIDVMGYRAGVIRGRELYSEAPEYSDLKVGDEVEATVLEVENELGELELSFRFAGQAKSWANVAALRDAGTTVEVEVIEANKGGLLVRYGHMLGFLPVSQLSSDHYPKVPGGDKLKIQEKLKSFMGLRLPVKVLDFDPEEDKLIVSEKKISDDEQKNKVAEHRVGEVHEGPITAITDFGAFMQFAEGLNGLIHISELAWQRVDHPSDVVKIGDVIKAEIINIDGAKVFLSRKRLLSDPWKTAEEKYKVGQMVSGKVLKVNPFGLFVELDSEIHGLCHVSELTGEYTLDSVKPGSTLEFRVISLRPSEHRLGLSLRADAPLTPTETTETPAV